MTLEAMVFAQGHFGYGPGTTGREPPYALGPWFDLGGCFGEFGFGDWDQQLLAAASAVPNAEEWDQAVSRDDQLSEASTEGKAEAAAKPAVAAAAGSSGRRKRRRAKVVKNKEEIETQRKTHIAVERNRRRQMNEYLAVLRSLMPLSYAQRGDQASIVGGAINYVKELEQLLQSLEVQKSVKNRAGRTDAGHSPFAGFFTFPQYSTSPHSVCAAASCDGSSGHASNDVGENDAAVADIEVTMVEGHASLRVLARRRPKQLLKLVAGLQHLRIPPLHLNMTTVDSMVLYSFSLKVEDGSKLGSVEDIAAAVHEILSRIQRQDDDVEAGLVSGASDHHS